MNPSPFKRILIPDVIHHKHNLTSHFPQSALGLFPHLQSEDVRFKEESQVRVSNLNWTSEVKGGLRLKFSYEDCINIYFSMET